MKLNRRSVLGAIGMIGVGTGAAFGSGAFTTVEAQREVEVNVLGGGDGLEVIGDLSSPESDIADNIAGTSDSKSSADVLVDTSSNNIEVQDEAGNSYTGSELFPSSGTYSGIGSDDYVSLVANDVKIVFGPQGNELPVDSTLTQNGLFSLVTRNGTFDVSFSTDTEGILTAVDDGTNQSVDGGDTATAEVTDTDSPANLAGTVETTDVDEGPETLTIEITDTTA